MSVIPAYVGSIPTLPAIVYGSAENWRSHSPAKGTCCKALGVQLAPLPPRSAGKIRFASLVCKTRRPCDGRGSNPWRSTILSASDGNAYLVGLNPTACGFVPHLADQIAGVTGMHTWMAQTHSACGLVPHRRHHFARFSPGENWLPTPVRCVRLIHRVPKINP